MKNYVIAGLVALALLILGVLAYAGKDIPESVPFIILAGAATLGLGNKWSSKKRNRRVRGA